MATQTTPNTGNKNSPAPTPSRDEKQKIVDAAAAAPVEPTAPPPTSTEAPSVPTRAQAKVARDELLKVQAELDRLMFVRNKAIQTLIDAGYDTRSLKFGDRQVLFSKRQGRNNGPVNYTIEDAPKPDDLDQS